MSTPSFLGTIRPLWTFLRSREEYGAPDLPLLTVISETGVELRDSSEGRAPSIDLSGYRVARPGDLVVNKMWARFGAYGVTANSGLVSPAYWVLKPDLALFWPRFLHYLLRSAFYRAEIWRRSKDLPPNGFDLPWNQFRSIEVPAPDLAVQRAIADYLDTETARIDALIEKKQRMVELLGELWSAVLMNFLFPSWATGVILLGDGEVPSLDGWAVRKLGSLTRPEIPIAYGILLPGPRLDEGIPYIGAGDVRPDRMRLDALPRTSSEIANAYPRTKMKTGEIVYAIRGSFGAVEQVPPELDGVNLSRDAARIAPGDGVDGRWLTFALKSELAQEQFRRREVGATITGINIEDLKSVRLPIPPRDEQDSEATQLDQSSGKYVRLVHFLESQIDLLAEHRQALITAAVTGELAIPGVAA